MPGRAIPLITDQVYHVLNRGTGSQPIFGGKRDYQRIWEAIFYYQNQNPGLSYSHFARLPLEQRTDFLNKLKAKSNFLVEIITLCLLPNHFHLLLKQIKNGGISLFMSNLSNSYTRYFNTKNKRIGHLFQGKFKAVRIETDEQLLHVSRYIHLNPYSSYIVKNLGQLEVYPYSSLPEYLGISKSSFFQKGIILNQFKNVVAYKKFVFDQADYQRKLEELKYLTLEK
ncbi:transposase [Candidatus Gottesmanbacteria bacterium]|nr:transposase [Candidatus Gottesmanbacteria bacterium]MBI5465450.1 transposase [Candidatus Gottesmanbacteria bacterium]